MLRARAPALSPGALRALAALADRLEDASPALFKTGHAAPLDVEFAVEGNVDERDAAASDVRVWILQARPITGGGFPEGGDAGTVWSRANVGEALPGPGDAAHLVDCARVLRQGFPGGVRRARLPRAARRAPRGQRAGPLLPEPQRLHGRSRRRCPSSAARALLTASGGASEAVIEALERQVDGVSRRSFLLRLPFTAPRQLARQARLEREVEGAEAEIDRARRRLFDMDLGIVPDDGLATTLQSTAALLDRTGTLMLACASASLASHLALCRVLERVGRRRVSARAGLDEAPIAEGRRAAGASWGAAEPIAQALAGGARELDSANPGLALARVAEVVRGDPVAYPLLCAGGVHAPADLPEGPARRAIEAFLDAYGDRAVREAELATPRWREDPAQVIAMLVSSLRAPPGDPDRALARARALADREMARLETRLSSVELALVRALVERTQRFTRLRERMRTWVTRVLGMIRAVALDLDRRLLRIDPSLLAGQRLLLHLRRAGRRAPERPRRGRPRGAPAPRRARARRGAARSAADLHRPAPAPCSLPPVPGMRLTGLPASGGVVEGLARVLEPGAVGLDDVHAGEILVSRTTDVGLSPLFLVAAAVVTELGGPLSHAAVVAREYGIPAVVQRARRHARDPHRRPAPRRRRPRHRGAPRSTSRRRRCGMMASRPRRPGPAVE